MLGNRALLNKQKRQAQKDNHQKQHQQASPQIFSPSKNLPASDDFDCPFNEMPLQITFRPKPFDEDQYIKQLLEKEDESICKVMDGFGDDVMKKYSIDELVDIAWGEFIVENWMKEKIRSQISGVWQEEVVKWIKTQGVQFNPQIMAGQVKDAFGQNWTLDSLIGCFNKSTHYLIKQIQHLTIQNNELQILSVKQFSSLKTNQHQLTLIKDKYLQVLKDFTEFKRSVHEKEVKIELVLEEKEKQLINCMGIIRDSENKVFRLENQISQINEQHEKCFSEFKSNQEECFRLEMLELTFHINSLIVSSQRPLISFHSDVLIKEQPIVQSQETVRQLLHSRQSIDKYQQKLDQMKLKIENVMKQTFSSRGQFIQLQSSQIHSLSEMIAQSQQLIRELNSFSDYELKVQKKDLAKVSTPQSKKSPLTSSPQIDQLESFSSKQRLMDEILATIKSQLINSIKVNKKTVDLIKQKDQLIIKLQKQVNQLINSKFNHEKEIQEDVIVSIKEDQFQYENSQIMQQSPIQMLGKQDSPQMSVNKSSSLKTQSEQQPINQFIINQNQKIQTQQVLDQQPIALKLNLQMDFKQENEKSHEQVQRLKQQNSSLRQEIQTLRQENQKIVERKIQTVQSPSIPLHEIQTQLKPTITQRVGKIKKLSTNNFPQQQSTTTSTSSHTNKQNRISDSNIASNLHSSQECKNPQCQTMISKLETKNSQYKQNIINLNQIVNYMINQLRGFYYGTILGDELKNSRSKQRQKFRMNEFSTIFGSSLPIRKFSCLENQLQELIKADNEYHCNQRLKTTSSFNLNQTIISATLNNTIKQVGRITSGHQSLANSQTNLPVQRSNTHYSASIGPHPTIKPHIKQRRQKILSNNSSNQSNIHPTQKSISKLLSRQILKQNFQNFEFIRKLCLKQNKCKDLLQKFHSYLDFYLNKIQELNQHVHVLESQNDLENDHDQTIQLDNSSKYCWEDNYSPDYESEIYEQTKNYGIKVRQPISNSRTNYKLR